MNTNYWDEQQLKKTDVFFFLLKMHTTYTYTQKEKSLKNTKINYTKDLLHHCLLIFWEDFFFPCVLQVSVLAKSFVLYKSLPFAILPTCWPPVLILG